MRWALMTISLGLGLFFGSFFFIKPAVIEVSPQEEPANEVKKEKLVKMILVGDIMLDRGVQYMVENQGNGDYDFPFLKISDYLQEADVLFGNLESVISDKGVRVGSVYSFRAEPEAINGLISVGFDVVSVANNHIFDYGQEAMEDSFLRLKAAGIDYVGGGFNEEEAYSPVVKEVNGIKIAFLAYTNLSSPHWAVDKEKSGIAWLEKDTMENEIKKAKNKADIVVVSFHYGDEYALEPNVFQTEISKAAIVAGADLVLGHHPHVVQPVEKYGSGYIAYSLGNFVFDQSFSEETLKGLLLKVITRDGKIKELIPVNIKINDFFQPELDEKIRERSR